MVNWSIFALIDRSHVEILSEVHRNDQYVMIHAGASCVLCASGELPRCQLYQSIFHSGANRLLIIWSRLTFFLQDVYVFFLI